jgi:hypothetical protein
MSQSRELKIEIDRLLELAEEYSHVELAQAWGGVTASLVGKLRGGWRPGRMDPHRRAAMKQLLARLEEAEAPMNAPSVPMKQAKFSFDPPASGSRVAESAPPTFVEHVLFTAGRIAELANQIASAAAQQQRVSYELGQRAEVEGEGGRIAEKLDQDAAARAALKQRKTDRSGDKGAAAPSRRRS